MRPYARLSKQCSAKMSKCQIFRYVVYQMRCHISKPFLLTSVSQGLFYDVKVCSWRCAPIHTDTHTRKTNARTYTHTHSSHSFNIEEIRSEKENEEEGEEKKTQQITHFKTSRRKNASIKRPLCHSVWHFIGIANIFLDPRCTDRHEFARRISTHTEESRFASWRTRDAESKEVLFRD